MLRSMVMLVSLLAGMTSAAGIVTDVTARQIQPWNGLVEIAVGLSCESNDLSALAFSFAATNSATKAAIQVAHITQNGDVTGSGTSWTRKFIWDAKADVGEVKINDLALTVGVCKPSGIQLWEDGPYWAECNVGAMKPEEYGYYFCWGDTVGYIRNANDNGWVSVEDGRDYSSGGVDCPTFGKSCSELESSGYIDSTGNLVARYDAATEYLGAQWRMPSDAEFSDLISKCATTWTESNGVNGLLVTGKGVFASKRIFLPASGPYWSSTPHPSESSCSWCLSFASFHVDRGFLSRYFVQSVRPVCKLDGAGAADDAASTHLSIDYTRHARIALLGVTALQQDAPNGLVDIFVSIQGSSNDVARAVWTFVATNSATKAAIQVAHITQNGDVTGKGTVWTRKFIWDAKVDAGEVKIEDVALTAVVELPFGGVQLWENGPYWSECNVGAATPEEYGYYFWWGDTVGYKRNSTNSGWESVKDGMPFSFSPGYCPTCAKSGYNLQLMGYIDSTGNLTTEHDAATQHCGAPWRMPTDVELDALTSNCDMTWTTRNGVYGYNVKGKGIFSTNNIFFPVAGYGYNTNISRAGGSYGRGYYWSSTPYSSDVACVLLFDSGNFNSSSRESRDCGQPVRPVREFGSASASVDTATTHLSIDCTPVVGIDLPSVTALQQGATNGSVDIVVTMSGTSNDVAGAVCLFFATNVATKAVIPVAHITQNGDVAGEGTIWTRKFVWDAKADVGSVKIEDVELTVRIEDQRGGVQLWENGPYWAESNVGATKPEEYGYYFWWGDTVGYERDGNNWNAVDGTKTGFSFDSGNSPTYGMSNSQLESEGYIDATGNLVAVNDAATAHLGAPWRMPTDAEFSALTKNCDREWTSRNGVFGQLVKGRGTHVSKSIFIPAAGQGDGTDLTSAGSYGNYWSSTPDFDNSNYAYYLRFYNGGFGRYLGYGRYNGRPVRPIRSVVCEISGSTTTHLSLDYEDQALPQGGPYTETVNGVEWTFIVDGDLKASVGGGSYDSGAVPLGTAGEISIPVMLGGRPVANIGSYAFHCRGGLTSVSIPNGVTNIGSFAFQGTGLTDVSIPTSVLHIGEDAFCGTPLMSSDNLFDLSVVDGWLLGYKYCTRPISPDEQPYEIPSARQTGGIVVPDGVRHIVDGALREASGNSGDGIWGWTIDFSALTLPTGLETIGANAFGYGNAIDGSEVEIRIPASVVRIGSTLFSRCKNLKVVFEGDRPEAADDSFCDADVYWGDDETQPFVVYYMDSRSGWSNGELWAGAITFSSDELPDYVRIDSPIRFADCPYWGFRFEGQMKGVPYKQEDCELKRGRTVAVITKRGRLDTYQPTNGSFFAIPVTGVSAKTEVQPVFTWATANQNMIADCQVLTDEEFRQLVSGGVSESTGWEKDDDDPDEVWLLQDFGTMTSHSREWPKGLWPNGASDGSRYWIYVRVNNLGYLDSELWSGDYTFRVGLGGTSEWTEPLHITFDTATIHSPSDMWSNVVFSGITGWSAEDLHQDVFEGLTFFGLGLFSGSFPFEAEVEVPSAGILYLYSGEGDDISDETLSVTSCAQINSETIQFGGGGQETDSWYPLENFCAYAGCGSLRTINVGSEATLSLKMKDTYQPKLELMRVQFFPAGKKSAAVEASFASVIKTPYKLWDFETYLQGKVTGTGVYSSGETVRLMATPGPGEAFDHWEVLLGEVPSGTNLLSPTLEFVMTDDVAGTPEERKQIIVRAVWREKCAVTALPVEAGTAVIDGSGLYFNGETVEFRVKPAEGYEFVKWLDGSTENPRTVSALSGGGDRVYYAVVEKADDGPDPDGGPYEGVVDGDTWLYSFKLSHMSEAFGAVCSLQDGEVEVGPGGRETDKWAVSPAPTGAVAVPQEVDGYSVVALGCSAFEDSELTSVSLPNTIRYLGGWCLSGCKKLESVSFPDSVVLVGDKAFDGCTKLKSVQLSRNLEYISWHAFDGCVSLTSICLPDSLKSIGEGAFADCSSLKTLYVSASHEARLVEMLRESGFDVSSVLICHSDSGDVFPAVSDIEDIFGVLSICSDQRLASNIDKALTYDDFREWALKIGATDVKASPFAWASFATDSAALLAKMPTDDDLKVEEFKPSAMAGSFDFTVSVKGVKIGDKASVDNLKKLFGLEGAESLDTAAFSSENVSLDFREPQDGKLKFTATPAVDNAKSFFMKVKVK